MRPKSSLLGVIRSPPGASKAPWGFRGSEKLLNLSKSNCCPLEVSELLKPDNPGDHDWLGSITRDTGTVRGRKDTFHRQARGVWVPRDGLFPLPVKERQVQGSLGMRAMAFSPCLSRKSKFQGPP